MAWTPPPSPLTWTLSTPLSHGGASFPTVTLREPTVGEVLKASAVRGAAPLEQQLRLISAISAEQVPYEALLGLPNSVSQQMADYLDLFAGSPMPAPLVAWQRAAADAESDLAAAP